MMNSNITLNQIESRRYKSQILENNDYNDKVNLIKFTKDTIIKNINNNKNYNVNHNFLLLFNNAKVVKNCINEFVNILEVASESNNSFKKEMINKLNEIVHYLDKQELNLLSNLINESSLSEIDKSKIQELIVNEKVINRILSNHNKLTKKYNFANYFYEIRNMDNHDIIFDICEMIDEYSTDIVPYGKYNIMLEEISYLFMKNAMDTKNIISEVTDYIVMKYANKDLYKQLISVVSNNKLLTESLNQPSMYMIESIDYADSDDVESVIKKFNKEEIKNDGILRKAINIIYTKSPASIIDGTPHILTWIRDIMILGIIGVHPIIGILTLCVDKFIQMSLRRKQAEKLVLYFEKEENKIIKKISNANGKKKENLETYLKAFKQSQNKLISYRDSLYSDKELDRKNAEMYNDEENAIDIEEFKIFKFQNIASLILDANKTISNIAKNIRQRNKFRSKVSKLNIKNLDFNKLNKSGIRSMIGENGKFSYCVSLFDISQCNINDVHGFLDNIVENLNLTYSKNDVIFTYTVMMNEASIDLTYNKYIYICEGDNEINEECFSEVDLYQCKKIFTISEAIDIFIGNSGDTIVDNITNLYKESFNSDIKEIISDYNYITENDNVSSDSSNIICMAEASILMNSLLTELSIGGKKVDTSVNVDDNKKENVSNIDKKQEIPQKEKKSLKPKKLDLNSIKLAMHGLKQKVKTMGQKEKEISRSIDIMFNGMTKGIEKALVSDRREAIIKGSIIPSFSKVIKTAIVAGGAFLISPTIAAIGAISALAMSKHLTKKERMLLVDEIDIELKVVDRELQRIDSNDKGSTGKYRSLVTYQKELQREKQRIMYNLNLAGKELPNIDKK